MSLCQACWRPMIWQNFSGRLTVKVTRFSAWDTRGKPSCTISEREIEISAQSRAWRARWIRGVGGIGGLGTAWDPSVGRFDHFLALFHVYGGPSRACIFASRRRRSSARPRGAASRSADRAVDNPSRRRAQSRAAAFTSCPRPACRGTGAAPRIRSTVTAIH